MINIDATTTECRIIVSNNIIPYSIPSIGKSGPTFVVSQVHSTSTSQCSATSIILNIITHQVIFYEYISRTTSYGCQLLSRIVIYLISTNYNCTNGNLNCSV